MPYIVEANETVRGNYKIISNGNHVQICFLPANIWNHNPRGGIKLGGLSLAKPKRVYVVRSSVMSHDYIRIVKQFSQKCDPAYPALRNYFCHPLFTIGWICMFSLFGFLRATP